MLSRYSRTLSGSEWAGSSVHTRSRSRVSQWCVIVCEAAAAEWRESCAVKPLPRDFLLRGRNGTGRPTVHGTPHTTRTSHTDTYFVTHSFSLTKYGPGAVWANETGSIKMQIDCPSNVTI